MPASNILNPDSRNIFSSAQVAEILDVHCTLVNRLCKEGILKAHKLGKNSSAWHIDRDSVMAYLEGLRKQAGLEPRCEGIGSPLHRD